MPANDTSRIVHTPESREHLRRIQALASAEGIDLTYARTGGTREPSESAAVRLAIAVAVGARPPLRGTPGWLPEPGTVTTRGDTRVAPAGDGAAKLRAAMERRGLRAADVAREMGLSSAGYVRAVACGARGLGGALLAWVEAQERAGEGAGR